MARPQKQTVDYFPHDTDASRGKTLSILQTKYGNDGYAFWFKLLELLGSSEGHYYQYKEEVDIEFLVSYTGVSRRETAFLVLETLAKLGAIDFELYQNQVIWCQKFVDRIEDAYRDRVTHTPQRPSFLVSGTGNPHAEGVSGTGNGVSGTGNPQTKLNKTKVNNKREAAEIWLTVKEELREAVNGMNFKTWFENTAGFGIDGDLFLVNVPNHQVQDYLIKNQKTTIESALLRTSSKNYVFAPVVEKEETI